MESGEGLVSFASFSTTHVCIIITIIAIMLKIPFIARNVGFTIFICGKLKIPAISASTPTTAVTSWFRLLDVIPSFRLFSWFILASKISAIPMISSSNAST